MSMSLIEVTPAQFGMLTKHEILDTITMTWCTQEIYLGKYGYT